MTRTVALACLVTICCACGLEASYVNGFVFLYPIESSSFKSWGLAQAYNDLNAPDAGMTLTGMHSVHGPQIFRTPVYGAGKYSYELEGPAQPGACYGTTLNVMTDPPGPFNDINETWSGDTVCAPPPPPPPPRLITLCDDGSNTGTCSPILINLASGVYQLSGKDDPVTFDIDADGRQDRITWTARGSAAAFLALDRNGNSTIDDGSELFGDATPLGLGARADNGFEALKELDTNRDEIVSVLDTRWSALLLWTDANHDGLSQPTELQRIESSAVVSIETGYRWSGRKDSDGNLFRYRGFAQIANNQRPVYDVYFRNAATN